MRVKEKVVEQFTFLKLFGRIFKKKAVKKT